MTLSSLRSNSLIPQQNPNAADFSNTATGTYSDSGVNYKYIVFTSSTNLIVTKAGYADIVITGGGGGGGSSYGAGGGAGAVLWGARWLDVGTVPVVCGAAGTTPGGGAGQGGNGGQSYLGNLNGNTNIAFGGGGGGGGGGAGGNGLNGASGGGGSGDNVNGSAGSALASQGNNGAAGVSLSPGGAGGGAGSAPPARTTAGAGVPLNITGSTVYYGCGGAPEGGTSTTGYVAGANGNGGNGRSAGSPGTITVRVRTN